VRNIGHQRRQKGKDDPGHAERASLLLPSRSRKSGGGRVRPCLHGHDEQFTSYEAQIDYYTNYIKGRDDWEFVGVYTDEGITGTSTKKP
jgi:hypothetical protein